MPSTNLFFVEVLAIHKQSAFLFGRDAAVRLNFLFRSNWNINHSSG